MFGVWEREVRCWRALGWVRTALVIIKANKVLIIVNIIILINEWEFCVIIASLRAILINKYTG
jgi:hypothetical protein